MFEQFATAFGDTVSAWARVEAAATARRLSAMVVLLDRAYAADGSADREQWYLDNWGAVAAEIGAEQNITQGATSHQLLIATALRDRLLHVAALFADGLVSYRVVSAITARTALVRDRDAQLAVDKAFAEVLTDWAPMSEDKLNPPSTRSSPSTTHTGYIGRSSRRRAATSSSITTARAWRRCSARCSLPMGRRSRSA